MRYLLTICVWSMLVAVCHGAISDNLISYWKMDEASGSALDAHSTNELTEFSGTIASASGKISNARDFEEADTENVQRADNAALSTGDIDFTFTLWVNPESLPVNNIVLSKDTFAIREYGFYYNGGLRWYVFGPASEYSEVNGGTLSLSTWAFVVVWHDATADEIGISINDGTPVTDPHTAGVRDSTASFVIGSRSDGTNYYDGLVDEVGFWKRKLSAGEITQLYNSGNGLAYKFGEQVQGPRSLHQYRLRSVFRLPRHPIAALRDHYAP